MSLYIRLGERCYRDPFAWEGDIWIYRNDTKIKSSINYLRTNLTHDVITELHDDHTKTINIARLLVTLIILGFEIEI